MSLAQKMKLQELTAKVESLSAPRRDLIAKQKASAAETIKNDVLAFFTSKGFEIHGNLPKVTASYHGGLQTVIDFKELIGSFFGSDGFVELKYNNKSFSIGYLVNRGELPELGSMSGTNETIEQQRIDFYESKLIPALKENGVSDLSGDFTIFSVTEVGGNQKQRQKHQNVEDVLNALII